MGRSIHDSDSFGQIPSQRCKPSIRNYPASTSVEFVGEICGDGFRLVAETFRNGILERGWRLIKAPLVWIWPKSILSEVDEPSTGSSPSDQPGISQPRSVDLTVMQNIAPSPIPSPLARNDLSTQSIASAPSKSSIGPRGRISRCPVAPSVPCLQKTNVHSSRSLPPTPLPSSEFPLVLPVRSLSALQHRGSSIALDSSDGCRMAPKNRRSLSPEPRKLSFFAEAGFLIVVGSLCAPKLVPN